MAVGLTPRVWSLPTKILWSTKSKALRKSSRAVLTDALAPSVARSQRWNIEISTNVVEEPGMKPNWLGLAWDSTTGCRAFSITKLSAIFDMVEVSEIGRRSLLKSETIGALGNGGTSASFHTRGTLASEKEAFKMKAMGSAKISAYQHMMKQAFLGMYLCSRGVQIIMLISQTCSRLAFHQLFPYQVPTCQQQQYEILQPFAASVYCLHMLLLDQPQHYVC